MAFFFSCRFHGYFLSLNSFSFVSLLKQEDLFVFQYVDFISRSFVCERADHSLLSKMKQFLHESVRKVHNLIIGTI